MKKSRLKIALFCSSRSTIPSSGKSIAASADLVGVLADGLSERGHDVTLYAPRGSRTKANLVHLGLPPFEYGDRDEADANRMITSKLRFLAELFRDAGRYDVIHLHTEPFYLGAPFVSGTQTPVVVTSHNQFLQQDRRVLKLFPKLRVVTISKRQAALSLPEVRQIRTVYNGINADDYASGKPGGAGFLFAGRVSEEKGIGQAIAAAQRTASRLDIAGPCTPEVFDTYIKPSVNNTIRYHGVVGEKKRLQLFRQARAALLPTNWEEPFGMVFVEAMASGTPVISFAQGAAPEIIKDGKTGYLVNRSGNDRRGNWTVKSTGITGIVSAVKKINAASLEEYAAMSHASRRHVEKHFTVERMLDGYEAAYQKVAKR